MLFTAHKRERCCRRRRVLIFLATIMPLDERSGVNLTGLLNTSHSTPVEDVPKVRAQAGPTSAALSHFRSSVTCARAAGVHAIALLLQAVLRKGISAVPAATATSNTHTLCCLQAEISLLLLAFMQFFFLDVQCMTNSSWQALGVWRASLNDPQSYHCTTPQGATDSNGQPVDAELYAAFWGLQSSFQNPYQALEPARWSSVVVALNRVLDAFGRLPIAFGRGAGAGTELGITVCSWEGCLCVCAGSEPRGCGGA